MAKPIFIAGLPESYSMAQIDEIAKALGRKLYDYHVLVYQYRGEDLKHEVLNAEDLTPLQYEELRAIVEATATPA